MEIKDKPLMNDISTVCRFPIPVDEVDRIQSMDIKIDVLKEVLETFYNVKIEKIGKNYRLLNSSHNWFCRHLESISDSSTFEPFNIHAVLNSWKKAENIVEEIIGVGKITRGCMLSIIESSLNESIKNGINLTDVVRENAQQHKFNMAVVKLKELGLEYTENGCFIIRNDDVLKNELITLEINSGNLHIFDVNFPPITCAIRGCGDTAIDGFIDKLIDALSK